MSEESKVSRCPSSRSLVRLTRLSESLTIRSRPQNALIANAKLKDELQLQSIGVDNLMQRFTQQARHFQEMVRAGLVSLAPSPLCVADITYLSTVRLVLHVTQKVANEILEQESKLHLEEVASMKKQQLSATRAIQKLRESSDCEQLEWKDHANRVIEELRQENLHLQELHELAQVRR